MLREFFWKFFTKFKFFLDSLFLASEQLWWRENIWEFNWLGHGEKIGRWGSAKVRIRVSSSSPERRNWTFDERAGEQERSSIDLLWISFLNLCDVRWRQGFDRNNDRRDDCRATASLPTRRELFQRTNEDFLPFPNPFGRRLSRRSAEEDKTPRRRSPWDKSFCSSRNPRWRRLCSNSSVREESRIPWRIESNAGRNIASRSVCSSVPPSVREIAIDSARRDQNTRKWTDELRNSNKNELFHRSAN